MNNNWQKGCDFGFKVGQRAWHSRFGWGAIISIDGEYESYPIKFVSDKIGDITRLFMADGCEWSEDLYPAIFHVEQTFDYSRPKWQPELGQLVWAWDERDILPYVRKFLKVNQGFYECVHNIDQNLIVRFKYVAPFDGKLPDEFKHLEGGSK